MSANADQARRLLQHVPRFPTATWGRDELRTGDMWNSNSLVSWLLVVSGHDVAALDPPHNGRAPGWFAGLTVAARETQGSQAITAAQPKRRIVRGILDLLGGLPLFVTAPVYRHWHMRWGATDEEARAPMRGDDLVPVASFKATRAIDIDAPPESVWPWIVQMGYKRAGFYTYDIADNAGYPSSDRVLQEYQHVTIGDWAFNMNSMFGIELPINEVDAFKVKDFELDEWLLWGKPDSTWSWLFKPLPDDRTRLILRIRAHPANLFWTLFMEFGDPPMARRMLKGVKVRAEQTSVGTRLPEPRDETMEILESR